MSLPRRDIVPVDPARNVADQDPPSRPGVQHQPPQVSMDGSQLVQWLSVQAGNMAGDLQHNVRVLMVRANSPMPVSDGRDEVSSLRKQLYHQQQVWMGRTPAPAGELAATEFVRVVPVACPATGGAALCGVRRFEPG